jgi:hypothetical protein
VSVVDDMALLFESSLDVAVAGQDLVESAAEFASKAGRPSTSRIETADSKERRRTIGWAWLELIVVVCSAGYSLTGLSDPRKMKWVERARVKKNESGARAGFRRRREGSMYPP